MADGDVNSSLFLPTDGIRLNTAPMLEGDYNGNGEVEQGDLDLLNLHWGDPAFPPPAGWVQDSPEGVEIDQEELDKVNLNWGDTQVFWTADFNRDGKITHDSDPNTIDDGDIVTNNQGILTCATIYEGDTDDDGDVDGDDLANYLLEFDQYQLGSTTELLLEAAALCQFPPMPVPGPAPFGQQPQPIHEAQPLAPIPAQPQAPGQVQPAGNLADAGGDSNTKDGPSFAEILSTPNPASSGHARYDDIAELLAITYDEWAHGDKWFAEEMWMSIGRVFGREVLPEPIRIVE